MNLPPLEYPEQKVFPNQLVFQGPPRPPLHAEDIMAAAEGGIFELELPDDFVTLLDEQRKMFTALFFKKMLQDLSNRKTREDADAKQYKAARDSMRKN